MSKPARNAATGGVFDHTPTRWFASIASALDAGRHAKVLTERPAKPQRERPADDSVRRHRERILVVEDNEMVRSLTVALLEHLGYHTLAADKAEAAITHLSAEFEISLMITDVVLPGAMDGFALAEQARVMRPGLQVLFVSGHPQDVLASRSALADVTDVLLMKPYTTQQLAEAVSRLLVESPHRPGPVSV